MEDNANLSQTFIENQKRLYKGAFLSRKILGLWVIADGLVYDTFSEEKHTVSRREILEKINSNEFCEYFLGLDWGWNHPLCCGLYGLAKNGIYYKINEFYGQKKTIDEVSGWILQKQREYGRYFRFINADNARPEQNDALERKLGTIRVYAQKPKVADSIELVRSIINYDRLIINRDDCKETLRELQSYRYPCTEETQDTDLPLKEDDDAMDEMRYALCFYETNFMKEYRPKT